MNRRNDNAYPVSIKYQPLHFLLVAKYLSTIYKSYSGTFKQYVYLHLKKHKLVYVALSQVTSLRITTSHSIMLTSLLCLLLRRHSIC